MPITYTALNSNGRSGQTDKTRVTMSNAFTPFLGAFNIVVAAIPMLAVLTWMGQAAL